MNTIAADDIVPDIYSWHQIGDWQREPDRVVPDFNTLRNRYNLPERPIDLNEYAWPTEQNPGTSAFYLAQLERNNLRGLRANWGSGSDLHNFMADLLFQNADGTYSANGEWQLYNYYAHMVGGRVATAASADIKFDVFATISGINVKIIAGTREVQSTYEIAISGMSHLGLPADGSIQVQGYRFDWGGKKAEVGSPADLGLVELPYTSDTVSTCQRLKFAILARKISTNMDANRCSNSLSSRSHLRQMLQLSPSSSLAKINNSDPPVRRAENSDFISGPSFWESFILSEHTLIHHPKIKHVVAVERPLLQKSKYPCGVPTINSCSYHVAKACCTRTMILNFYFPVQRPIQVR